MLDIENRIATDHDGPMDHDGISATIPDWTRERCDRFWDPGRRLLRSIRGYQACKNRGLPWRWLKKYWVLQHRLWSVAAGAEIPLDCEIGGGLLLPHPNGIMIHPGAVIGANAVVLQNVPEESTAIGVPARVLPRRS